MLIIEGDDNTGKAIATVDRADGELISFERQAIANSPSTFTFTRKSTS